jgi:hypothetical protein
LSPHVNAELERRVAMNQRADVRRLRKAAERQQAELWALVAPVLAELRDQRVHRAPPPPDAGPGSPQARALIANLRAQQAAPPAAAAE